MRKKELYPISILGGLLCTMAWPTNGFPFLIFIAFVPLLWIEFEIQNNPFEFRKLDFFKFSFLAMLVWNLGVIWWVAKYSIMGMLLVSSINAFLMALVWFLFHYIKQIVNLYISLFFLIVAWLSFEYMGQRWILAFPWLNLGNVFASYHQWIQWYQFTGVGGGTLWILVINILIFHLLKNIIFQRAERINNYFLSVITFLLIAMPSIISFYYYHAPIKKNSELSVGIIQPNIDSYHNKFNPSEANKQFDTMLKLAYQQIPNQMDLIVFPETAIVSTLLEDSLQKYDLINRISILLSEKDIKSAVIGARTIAEVYGKGKRLFNSAIHITNSKKIGVYRKEILVPQIEQKILFSKTPYNSQISNGELLNPFKYPSYSQSNFVKNHVLICYESVFGEFAAKKIRNAAEFLIVMTNDGWWDKTPGLEQHFNYSRLRAIENQCYIVRCANTGISGFINPKGDVIHQAETMQALGIYDTINRRTKLSFYSRHGDYIGKFASFAGLLILIVSYFFLRKKSSKKIVID